MAISSIAVGNTSRQFSVKVGSKFLYVPIEEFLGPVQLGYSIKGDGETAHRYVESAQQKREIEITNVLNSLRRDVFYAAAR